VTPQSSFAVVAPIATGRESDLRACLASMNHRTGVVDPENAVVPFGRFEQLHFARFVILDDRTVGDIAAHGVTPPRDPPLASSGTATDRRRIPPRAVGRRPGGHLLALRGLLRAWRSPRVDDGARAAGGHPLRELGGRTVRQVREHALRQALDAHAQRSAAGRRLCATTCAPSSPGRQARLTPTAAEPTPLGWRLRLVHLIGVPLACSWPRRCCSSLRVFLVLLRVGAIRPASRRGRTPSTQGR
jgi:hypothetical protein